MKLKLEQIVTPHPKVEKKSWKTRYNIVLMYDGYYSRILTIKTYVL